MKLTTFVRAALIAATLAAVSSVAAANPPPQIQPPKILVIDRQAILVRSAAGQSVMVQARQAQQQAENDLKSEAESIRSQGQKLQQQLAVMSASVKEQKMKAYESQRSSLEQKAQQKQGLIQGGVFAARNQIGAALEPILRGIMAERGANMLVDKNAVVFATVDIDITPIAIQRLNQKMPTVKFTLTPLPPGVSAQ
jgi:Skp family chaperone for outer membrane proteins